MPLGVKSSVWVLGTIFCADYRVLPFKIHWQALKIPGFKASLYTIFYGVRFLT